MREIAENIFREADIHPDIAFEFDLLLSAVCYAEAGLGACFFSDTIQKEHPSTLSLYIPDTKFSSRTVYLIKKKNRHIGTATNEFINLVASFLRQN